MWWIGLLGVGLLLALVDWDDGDDTDNSSTPAPAPTTPDTGSGGGDAGSLDDTAFNLIAATGDEDGVIEGTTGADKMVGSESNDSMSSGPGDDWIQGQGGDDTLYGGSGDDAIYGGNGADLVGGGAGEDWLIGGAGDDILDAAYLGGGTGLLENTADFAAGGFGDDFIQFGVGDTVRGDDGTDDYIFLVDDSFGEGSAVATVEDMQGIERLTIDPSFLTETPTVGVVASGESDTMVQVNGQDAILLSGVDSGTVTIDGLQISLAAIGGGGGGGGAVIDPLNEITATGEEDGEIVGTAGADHMIGSPSDDQMAGAGGNDWIEGNAGNDTLYGGVGDDAIYGNEGDDEISGGADADWLFGGPGSDIVDGAFVGGGSDALDNTGDTLLGGFDDDSILMGVGDSASGQDGVDTFTFYADDTFGEGAQPAQITDLVGGETLFISEDSLSETPTVTAVASGETDTMVQVNGVDAVLLSDVDAALVAVDGLTVTVALGGGGGGGGGAVIDPFNEITATGEEDGEIVGTAEADHMIGSETDDQLAGAHGDDWIEGNAGNDTLYGGVGADAIYGNEGDDEISGGADADYLHGGQGADLVDGAFVGGGSDLLDNTGDTVNGGKGDDSLLFGVGDSVAGQNGTDTFTFYADDTFGDSETVAEITDLAGGETLFISEDQLSETPTVTAVASGDSDTMIQLNGVDAVLLSGVDSALVNVSGLNVAVAVS